ncbi:MAG TPA: hypothetical protein VGO93_16545 [Candidatus Xenobia bacterium]
MNRELREIADVQDELSLSQRVLDKDIARLKKSQERSQKAAAEKPKTPEELRREHEADVLACAEAEALKAGKPGSQAYGQAKQRAIMRYSMINPGTSLAPPGRGGTHPGPRAGGQIA